MSVCVCVSVSTLPAGPFDIRIRNLVEGLTLTIFATYKENDCQKDFLFGIVTRRARSRRGVNAQAYSLCLEQCFIFFVIYFFRFSQQLFEHTSRMLNIRSQLFRKGIKSRVKLTIAVQERHQISGVYNVKIELVTPSPLCPYRRISPISVMVRTTGNKIKQIYMVASLTPSIIHRHGVRKLFEACRDQRK